MASLTRPAHCRHLVQPIFYQEMVNDYQKHNIQYQTAVILSLTFHYNLVSCHGSFSFPQRRTRWSPIKEMHFAIVEGNIFVRTLCEGGLKSGRRDYLPTPQEENHADFKNLISSSKTGCSDILCVIVANIRCNILNYPLI